MNYILVFLSILSLSQAALGEKLRPLIISWHTDGCDDPLNDQVALLAQTESIVAVQAFLSGSPVTSDAEIADLLQVDYRSPEVAAAYLDSWTTADREGIAALGLKDGILTYAEYLLVKPLLAKPIVWLPEPRALQLLGLKTCDEHP